ncbi:squalene/phytoene synthase family protein [Paenibacillus glycanilyticus]|uniref:squalene/phytoene synthase family protein n=1 Tax=Paenibacillus glycanilyticus TaxID=126569 RepID=UPI003EBF83A1
MEGIPITNMMLNDAMTMLKLTSRTFYIPISKLIPELKEAVSSAYLCMRAIDEVEDDEKLPAPIKKELLLGAAQAMKSQNIEESLHQVWQPYRDRLPEVTVRMSEWAQLCPAGIAPTVYNYITMMAEQMADWVGTSWNIRTEEDLDKYTYSVAGMVGEMLSDIWRWYDGTETDRVKAVAFGRGLQAVNIMRNRSEDLERGVDFFPDGWDLKDMLRYTRRNLKLADEYLADLKKGPARTFCQIPLSLAHATVNLIAVGGNKLTRDAVLKIVSKIK